MRYFAVWERGWATRHVQIQMRLKSALTIAISAKFRINYVKNSFWHRVFYELRLRLYVVG